MFEGGTLPPFSPFFPHCYSYTYHLVVQYLGERRTKVGEGPAHLKSRFQSQFKIRIYIAGESFRVTGSRLSSSLHDAVEKNRIAFRSTHEESLMTGIDQDILILTRLSGRD